MEPDEVVHATDPDATDVDAPRPPFDPVAVAAIVVGCIGIVVLGILAAIVTAVLASEAGRRARADGRSQENSYWAFGLAVLDAVVWIVLQSIFALPFLFG